jgi:hypothetical protein
MRRQSSRSFLLISTAFGGRNSGTENPPWLDDLRRDNV